MKDIASQFALMMHAAQHPSPAVRNMAGKFASNITQMKKLHSANNVLAARTLQKIKSMGRQSK